MKIAVIGGGPAGMMAAYAAAINKAQVTLFERNEKLGKKLFLTGKGRCNFTNIRPIDEFFSQIPKNAKFLYSALYNFTNQELISLFEQHGLSVKTERGGRVFPASDKSSDVIKVLSNMLKQAGVEVLLHTNTESLCVNNNGSFDVKIGNKTCFFDAVILATGGLSYSSTGSNGDGLIIAKKMGHEVTKTSASLIPLRAKGESAALCKQLTGLSLKNVGITLCENGKNIYEEQGEVLFTHFGLSGPLALSASAHISDYTFAKTEVNIDFKPALDAERLDARLLRDFEAEQNKQLKSVLTKLLPKALCVPVMYQAGIAEDVFVHDLKKGERAALVCVLKKFVIDIAGTRSIEEAIITRGGVNVRGINPSTMESKLVKNLYICGEMVDVDAYTGGYNLQIAFSTGYLAGCSAASGFIDN